MNPSSPAWTRPRNRTALARPKLRLRRKRARVARMRSCGWMLVRRENVAQCLAANAVALMHGQRMIRRFEFYPWPVRKRAEMDVRFEKKRIWVPGKCIAEPTEVRRFAGDLGRFEEVDIP